MQLSIIIPIKDQKDLTQVCIDSLGKYTKDYELILIDDGSKIKLKNPIKSLNIKIIRNDVSIGYTKSVNKGIKVAEGEYVVIANNDIVFTPCWAEKMINHFKTHGDLGVLSPTTNKITGQQSVDYNKKGITFQYIDNLIFFCVMIKKDVFESIGLLDERFSPGGQEDLDFCKRASISNWKVGIARDVFIYHYGSLSFRSMFKNDINKSIEYSKSRTDLLNNKYKKKKVFIGIPNMGTVVTGLRRVLSVWEKDVKYDIKIYDPECVFPLDNARNSIVKEFLELDYDYLLWIDDDIVPPIYALDKLVESNKDVVGAACFSMKADSGNYFPYPVTLRYNEEKRYQVYYGSGLEEVDATGGACILVKRKVYEQLERPYEFVYHKDGTLALTCDFRIWQKWQALGGEIYINFDVLCDHQKKCSIKGIQDLLAKNLNNKEEEKNYGKSWQR